MAEVRCQSCGHAASRHDNNGCQIRILTNWSEETKAFQGERLCNCHRYCEPPNPNISDTGCPHERLKESPACVHCGQAVAERVE